MSCNNTPSISNLDYSGSLRHFKWRASSFTHHVKLLFHASKQGEEEEEGEGKKATEVRKFKMLKMAHLKDKHNRRWGMHKQNGK